MAHPDLSVEIMLRGSRPVEIRFRRHHVRRRRQLCRGPKAPRCSLRIRSPSTRPPTCAGPTPLFAAWLGEDVRAREVICEAVARAWTPVRDDVPPPTLNSLRSNLRSFDPTSRLLVCRSRPSESQQPRQSRSPPLRERGWMTHGIDAPSPYRT